jgi:flagellar motility protein MotE (MotC chaperone)
MKKLFNVVVLTLAINFLALAGGIGYLYQSKRLDKEKVHAIREMVFPTSAPSTQPAALDLSEIAATRPVLNLEALLASASGLPAAEQVEMIQKTADFRIAEMERRHRELLDLQNLVTKGQTKLKVDREKFEKEKAALDAREQEAARLASDKGFQDSLKLYGTMKPKQIKDVFANLADDVVVRYLRALEPRQVVKILAEFKTPAEVQRVKALMEQVRSAEPAAPAKQ